MELNKSEWEFEYRNSLGGWVLCNLCRKIRRFKHNSNQVSVLNANGARVVVLKSDLVDNIYYNNNKS